MLIEVTEKDIKKNSHCSYNCPIAMAIKRAFGNSHVVSVYKNISIDGEIYPTPKSAFKFITDFDAGKPVKPFRFRLRIKEG